MVKVGGTLSRPIPILRGIRQGCPLSGQLYSLAVEPLLFKLPGFSLDSVSLSAYADDITVVVNHIQDIKCLSEVLILYEKASSAKVNWAKSEAFWAGKGEFESLPKLPGNLKWGKEGLKLLGVFWRVK